MNSHNEEKAEEELTSLFCVASFFYLEFFLEFRLATRNNKERINKKPTKRKKNNATKKHEFTNIRLTEK